MDVGGGTDLERDTAIANIGGQPAQIDRSIWVHRDVINNANAMPQTFSAAVLDGFPDRRWAVRLAGMDREVEVLSLDVLERVEMSSWRVARFGTRNVEPDHALVSMSNRQFSDL